MRNLLLFVLTALSLAACVKDRVPSPSAPSTITPTVNVGGRKLIHYWNFNGSNLTAPDTTIGGAALVVDGTGVPVFDAVSPGTSTNARRDTVRGMGFRVRNPANSLTVKIPTTGYKQPIVSFAAQRSSSGPPQNAISYTLNGTNYTTTSLTPATITLDVNWTLFYFDFSAISGADNNPNFAVRLTFTSMNTGLTGNDRYDNIAVNANPLPVVPPVIIPPVNVGSRKLIHYWNFNGTAPITAPTSPAPDTTIGGAVIIVDGTGSPIFDAVADTAKANARRGSVSGNALRVRNPVNAMTIKVPTTGYKQPIVSFAASRTSSGPQQNVISYTLDGTNYLNTGLPSPTTLTINTLWTLYSFNFSTIAGADDNPNFAIRITFGMGNLPPVPPAVASGNDRYDNISVDAFKK